MPRLRILLILVLLTACSRTPNTAELKEQARQYAARGEIKAAIIQLKNALQQEPSDGQARLQLGNLYLDAGELPAAEKELRRAKDLGVARNDVLPPLATALLQQAQYGKVMDEIGAGEQQSQLLALRGLALLGLNRKAEARDLFLQMPGEATAMVGMARLALLDNNQDEALQSVVRALQLRSDYIDALRMKGDLLRMQDKNDEALSTYRQVLKLHPAHLQAHLDIASLHIQSGKLEDARRELNAARQISSGNMLLMYTQALLDFRENKLSTAQEHLQLVLRIAPGYLPANLLMGAVLRGGGQYGQAEPYLRKFLDTYPGHPYASKLLASVLLSRGQPNDALTVITPLLETHQQDLEVTALAGESYLRLRQYTKAANYFERASTLSPQTTMLHAALAMSHTGAERQGHRRTGARCQPQRQIVPRGHAAGADAAAQPGIRKGTGCRPTHGIAISRQSHGAEPEGWRAIDESRCRWRPRQLRTRAQARSALSPRTQ